MTILLALHIVFLIVWSATLLYFPQLLRQHACIREDEERRQAVHLQRTIYALIMTPSAILTIIAGCALIFALGFDGGWLHVKLLLVLLMVAFHAYCGTMMLDLKHAERPRLLNRAVSLLPMLLIGGVLVLVLAKPF